jgi:primosomal protein N'
MERITVDGDETTALRPTGETRCGWCGHVTAPERCRYCGRDPLLPYRQRGVQPPAIEVKPGRPGLDEAVLRRRLADARQLLGPTATVEELAEQLDVSPRTARRWLERVDGR